VTEDERRDGGAEGSQSQRSKQKFSQHDTPHKPTVTTHAQPARAPVAVGHGHAARGCRHGARSAAPIGKIGKQAVVDDVRI
jgi:hypothetical protein